MKSNKEDIIDEVELAVDGATEVEDVPKRRRSLGRRLWRVVWITALSIPTLLLVMLLLYRLVFPPLTPLMVQRFVQQVKDSDREVNFERDYVRIEDISPNMVTAVVASEDGRFMRHKGFDVPMLKQSYKENQRGRRVRGGSTISMQTAKNCFLPHNRTMWRKAAEAYYTILMETFWSKERIMECYLNIVEFGDGIYGCEAAAQHYFHHSAAKLTRNEAAQLAATLPSPLKRNPAHSTPYFRKRTAAIQSLATKYGRINLQAKREDLNPKYLKEMDETLWDFLVWKMKQ